MTSEASKARLWAQVDVSGRPKPPHLAAAEPEYPVNMTNPKFSAHSDKCDV